MKNRFHICEKCDRSVSSSSSFFSNLALKKTLILLILLVVNVLLKVESEYVGLDAVPGFGINTDKRVAFVEKFLFQRNDDAL